MNEPVLGDDFVESDENNMLALSILSSLAFEMEWMC